MPNLFRFRSLFLVFVLLVIFYAPSTVIADSGVGNPQLDNKGVQNFYSLMLFVGCSVGGEYLIADCNKSNNVYGFGQYGLFGYVTDLIDSAYSTPPVSSNAYISNIVSNFSPIKDANAQVSGSGSQVISVIFIFWQAARNISYLLMAVIFVVIGLMVMFGRKMGTAPVTVQSALPGMVIGLVMVTFSYFISALLVDLAFVGTHLVGYTFVQIVKVSNADPVQIIIKNNIINLYSSFIPSTTQVVVPVASTVQELVDADPTFGTIVRTMVGAIMATYTLESTKILSGVGGGAGNAVQAIAAAAAAKTGFESPAPIIGFIVMLFLMFAIMYAMIRVLLALVSRYINILFLTIAAPFTFMYGSLPGNQSVIWAWVKNMLCCVLAFPAIFAGLYFAAFFIGPSATVFGITRGSIIGGGATLPIFGNMQISLLTNIIGFGILLGIPAIPDWVCKGIKAGTDSVFGKEVSTRFNEGRSGVTSIVTGTGKAAGSFKRKPSNSGGSP